MSSKVKHFKAHAAFSGHFPLIFHFQRKSIRNSYPTIHNLFERVIVLSNWLGKVVPMKTLILPNASNLRLAEENTLNNGTYTYATVFY